MWDLILNPMITLLTLLYSVFGNNMVLSIVVLTFIIRMIMYPMLAKQQESAKKMQEMQPRLKKLQEKYKDDKEKLSQVQMELYKEAGVNPLGGCLPMVLQFPIFIALYSAINFAVASTPFQLVDLSERLMIPGLDGLIPLDSVFLGMDLTAQPQPPDNPIYALALPLLVMVTTYFQFKMSSASSGAAKAETKSSDEDKPNQAQAMQKSMGTVMPIMFGFISLSLSVGLSIYFLTSNVVGIIQYSPMGKQFLDKVFSGGRKKKDDDEVEPVISSKKSGKARKT
jgi:YidC/Oxa1 family membrane protein insertase